MAVASQVRSLPEGMTWERPFSEVRKEFIKENGKEISKIFLYATRWMDQLQRAIDTPLFSPQGPLASLTLIKNGFGVLDLETKWDKAVETYYDEKKTNWDRLQSITEIMNPLVDGAGLVNTVALGSLMTVMPTLKAAHSIATLVGASIGTHKSLSAEPAKTEEERQLNWIELGRNVSYVVVGAVGTLSLLVAIKAQEIIILMGLTAGTAFTVYGMFYKREVNPKQEYSLLGTANLGKVFKEYNTLKQKAAEAA